MLLVGTLGLTASFVWLSSITTTSTYAGHLLGALVLNGVSAALVFMPVTVVVLGGVDRAQAGTVSGLLQTAQQLGGAVGLAAIVSVYASRAVPGQFVPGVEPAFLTSASFTLVALLVAALVLRPRPARTVEEQSEPSARRSSRPRDAPRRRLTRRRQGRLIEQHDVPASGGVITPPDAGPSAHPITRPRSRRTRGAGDD